MLFNNSLKEQAHKTISGIGLRECFWFTKLKEFTRILCLWIRLHLLCHMFLFTKKKQSLESFVCESNYTGCAVSFWFTKEKDNKSQFFVDRANLLNNSHLLNLHLLSSSLLLTSAFCYTCSIQDAIMLLMNNWFICSIQMSCIFSTKIIWNHLQL